MMWHPWSLMRGCLCTTWRDDVTVFVCSLPVPVAQRKYCERWLSPFKLIFLCAVSRYLDATKRIPQYKTSFQTLASLFQCLPFLIVQNTQLLSLVCLSLVGSFRMFTAINVRDSSLVIGCIIGLLWHTTNLTATNDRYTLELKHGDKFKFLLKNSKPSLLRKVIQVSNNRCSFSELLCNHF